MGQKCMSRKLYQRPLKCSTLNFMNDTEPLSHGCFQKNKRVVEADGANAFLKRHRDAS